LNWFVVGGGAQEFSLQLTRSPKKNAVTATPDQPAPFHPALQDSRLPVLPPSANLLTIGYDWFTEFAAGRFVKSVRSRILSREISCPQGNSEIRLHAVCGL